MNVRRVAVIGGGTMGRGIAQSAAQAGYEVTLRDVKPEILRDAEVQVRASLDKLVDKQKIRPEDRETALRNLRTSSHPTEGLAGVDLVIEAVPEDLALKRRVFGSIEETVGPHAILASNTSSLSITQISQGVRVMDRVIGMHFFNPVPLMPLVEVVRGHATRDDVVEAVVAVARKMGKEPIVVQDSPGFASSRLGIALGMEAIRMLEQGVASAEAIDQAMELGYKHPMGPLKLTDLVGLDVRLAIAEHLHKSLGSEVFRPPELLRRMVAEGRLGRKSGRGFYAYEGDA